MQNEKHRFSCSTLFFQAHRIFLLYNPCIDNIYKLGGKCLKGIFGLCSKFLGNIRETIIERAWILIYQKRCNVQRNLGHFTNTSDIRLHR